MTSEEDLVDEDGKPRHQPRIDLSTVGKDDKVTLKPKLPSEGTFFADCIDAGMAMPAAYWGKTYESTSAWNVLGGRDLFERAFELGFTLDRPEWLDPEDYWNFDDDIKALVREVATETYGDLFLKKNKKEHLLADSSMTLRELRDNFYFEYLDHAEKAFGYGQRWREQCESRISAYGRKTGTNDPDIPAAPDPHPNGVSPREAEFVVAQWVRRLGDLDVEVTQTSRDGGYDVAGRFTVTQVKHYTDFVSVSDVRAIYGVAVSLEKVPLFFTSGRYTKAGESFARMNFIPLFRYSAEKGTLIPENNEAKKLMKKGVKSYCGYEK